MYPLIFDAVFKPKIWGGYRLNKIYNLENSEKLGEAWVLSSHPNGKTKVINGKFNGSTIDEILENHTYKLVGKKVYDKYKNKFPILVKYLDINDKLSIQVHPDDKYALVHNNEFGKSECWYVLDAINAKIILGTNQNIKKNKLIDMIKAQNFKDVFNVVDIKKDDFIDITPGTVHASLEGSIFIAEIRQNSDVTYRIYDFDRIENGKKRDLHLEDAINTIDFNKKIKVNNTKEILNNTLIQNEYFITKKIDLSINPLEIFNTESFEIITPIKGSFKIYFEDEILNVKFPQNVLIPVSTKVKISGDALILKTHIGE